MSFVTFAIIFIIVIILIKTNVIDRMLDYYNK